MGWIVWYVPCYKLFGKKGSMPMKIVSGLGSIDDYIVLTEAGADEFFCGYVPYAWNQPYGILSPLNRREVLFYNVQIGTKGDLYILKKMTDYYGVPVKITFNSLCYMPEQYPLIGEIMMECIKIGFDVFIVSDLGLILYIRENKIPCKIHLSGETAEVNRPMIQLFEDFDITRIIFHRKNSIQDMKRCIDASFGKGMEFEAFALNEYCHFSGAFCNSLHCDELPHLCKVPYEVGNVDNTKGHFLCVEKKEWKEEEEGYITGSTGCGLCALKEMEQAGVTHLKLVGRGNYTDYMVEDMKQMRKALHLVEEMEDVESYKRAVKEELFERECPGNCYYKY